MRIMIRSVYGGRAKVGGGRPEYSWRVATERGPIKARREEDGFVPKHL